jgi:hypothetical protein
MTDLLLPDARSVTSWRSWLPRVAKAKLGHEVVIGGVIGFLTWPTASATAKIGIDVSWIVGLHLAARRELLFGRDIVFTFGPLGFLGSPQPYIAWTSVAALLFVAAVHFTACLTLLHLARQTLGLPKATVLVLAAAFTFPWIAGWGLYGILLFAAVATALYRRRERPTEILFAVALGLAIGVAGLGKFNVAIVGMVIAVLGVASTARSPLRSIAAFGVAAAITIVILWLATGQRLADLPVYVSSGVDLSVGYSQSMGATYPQTEWMSGVALLATFVLIGVFWRRASTLPRRDCAVLCVITAVTILAAYKGGFTRAGVGVGIYLATLLAIWPVVAPRERSWAAAGIPLAGIMAAFLAVGAIPIPTLFDPLGRLGAFGSQVTTALFHRSEAAAGTASSLRDQYSLPPEALALLAGRTVHIEPWEAAVAEAYPEFVWTPEPVFQSYAAYMPNLDRLNADRLTDADGPDRILWITPPGEPLSIDGRSLWFDAPAAKIEMLCRYVPLAAEQAWQVLGRVPNRCGAPIAAGRVISSAGEPTRVPPGMPQGIVTMRILGVASDPLSQLQITIDHGGSWSVSDGQSVARIPLGTAAEPNVIGATRDVGYRGPLSLGPPPATVTIGPRAGAPGAGTPLNVEFAVIPVFDQP